MMTEGVGTFLARHGRTASNRARRFQGRSEVGLDEVGRRQSADLARRVAAMGFVALWTSPLGRARETAAIVGEMTGLAVTIEPGLAEIDVGVWQDELLATVRAAEAVRLQRFLAGDPAFRFPGGESFREAGGRIVDALRHVAAGPRPALAISHGMVMRLALAQRDGVPGPAEREIRNGELVRYDVPTRKPG